ncbi:MAG: hypothetical protein M1828_006758 [Chrysothrix sp. TS-e1954]|nr:MAG: hypothetical protein M1828_006758 [Chrysothrix sp. TS-e1954]
MENNAELQERFSRCLTTDTERDQFFKVLIDYCNDLDRRLQVAESECENDATNVERIVELERQIENKKRGVDSNGTVVVLIDGDALMFEDKFVQDADYGGQKAASVLRESIESFLRSSKGPTVSPTFQLVLRIYLNLQGLSRAYQRAGVVEASNYFERFVRTFNTTYPLFDIIDTGDEKEHAAGKIRDLFQLYVEDDHCDHIFFGGNTDSGYSYPLIRHATNHHTSRRITVLGPSGLARSFEGVTDCARTLNVPNIFRSHELDTAVSKASSSVAELTEPDWGNIEHGSRNTRDARRRAHNISWSSGISSHKTTTPVSEPCEGDFKPSKVGLTSFFNTAQGHATTRYTRRIYNARPSEVTPLSSRTFGTWTALSGLVRLFAAYNITNQVAFDLGFSTFVIAWLHFVEEMAIWGTAGVDGGVVEPAIVSTLSAVWMWWTRNAYLG